MIADELFWAKVNKSGPCWVWTGAKNPAGYGVLRRANSFGSNGPRNYLAHRYSLMLLGNGMDLGDQQVDHICHNPACVRYFHLRLATNKQNHENLRGANRNSASGIRGVFWSPARNHWRAEVKHHYKSHTKTFKDRGDAEAWVLDTRLRLFTYNSADRR